MSNKFVKIGIVGCGDIAAKWYIPYLRIQNGKTLEFVATCDSVEERARKAKEEGGAKEYYTDLEAMLKKADLDALIMTLPAMTRINAIVKAAEARKHLLIQKPMAMTLEDADIVVDTVRNNNIKAIAEPAPALNSWFQLAKKLIEEDTIGKICYMHAICSHANADWAEWFYTKVPVVFDMGVYPIGGFTALIGPAKKVVGYDTISIPKRYIRGRAGPFGGYGGYGQPVTYIQEKEGKWIDSKVSDNNITIIDFGEGTLACVETNWCTVALPPDCQDTAYRIQGDHGAMILKPIYQPSSLMFCSGKKKYPDDTYPGWFSIGGVSGPSIGPDMDFSKTMPPFVPYHQASVDHLIDCIVNDKKPIPDVEWGRHVTEIMVKSCESAKSGKAMSLSTTF